MAYSKRLKAVIVLATAMVLLATSVGADSAPEVPGAPRPLMVSGIVLNAFEGGIAGARVELVAMPSHFATGERRLQGLSDPAPVAVATSNGSGRFSLESPNSGVFRMIVRAEKHAPVQYFPLVVVEDLELPPVSPPPARDFAVRVIDTDDAPLREIWVFAEVASARAWSQSGWRLEFRRALTDASGRALIPRLEGERLSVTAFPVGRPAVDHPGSSGNSLTLISEGGAKRRIRVLGKDGEPVAGVVVRVGELAWPVGLTNADGRLDLYAQGGESLKVRLYAADGRHQLVRLPSVSVTELPAEGEIDISLREPTHLIGKILDTTDQKPLSGVVIWPGSDPGAWVRTDAQGLYQLVAPEAERFWLQAEALGHVPLLTQFEKLTPGTHRVPTKALDIAVDVFGRVVDGAGRDLSDVRLTVLRPPSAGRRPFVRPDEADGRGATGDQGRFALHSLQPGKSYELVVLRAGFLPGKFAMRAPGNPRRGLARGGRPAPLKLVLQPSRAAVGRVVDSQDVPVVGADVVTAPAGVPARSWQTAAGSSKPSFSQARTDHEGQFRLAGLPSSEVDLRVRAAGFAPTTVRGIEVPAGSGAADLGTIVMTRGAKISGRVVDGEGEGISGVAVHALPHQLYPDLSTEARLDRRRPEAESGPGGFFAIADLAVGSQVDLLARGTGFLPGRLRAVGVPALNSLTIELERAAGVHGWVRDEEEQPVEGAEVFLEWSRTLSGNKEFPVGSPSSGHAVSDETGFFEFSGVRPGKISMQVVAEGYVASEPTHVEAPEAGSSQEILVVLERGSAVVGEILDSAGVPILGARVALGDASAFSDAEGIYRVEGVAEGPVTAEVYHPHYERQRQEIEIEPGDNSLDWELPEGQEVVGRVVDHTGEPVAGALVRLRRILRGYREQRQQTGADGTFLFSPVAAGEFRLQAEGAGFALTEYPAVVAVVDQAVQDLEVVLQPGASIRGRVLGLDYDQLVSVQVVAYRSKAERSWPAKLDYEGNYEIVDLPSGDWVIQAALRTGHRQVEERVTLTTATEVHRDLEFVPRLALSGEVLLDEEPLADAVVSLRGFEVDSERSVSTDYQGIFHFEDLEAGSYWLGVQHSIEWLVHNDSIDLHGDREITIRLERATVDGYALTEPERRPVAGAMILLERLSKSEHEVGGLLGSNSDATGFFSFPRVTPGSYRMKVKKSGFVTALEEIEVPVGGDLRGLEAILVQTSGLELDVQLASGIRPARIDVLVQGPGGVVVAAETQVVDDTGRAHLDTVPSGAWEILVSAPGAGITQISATAPGEAISVALPVAGPLQIRVPALVTSNRLATVTLSNPQGHFLRVLDSSRAIQDRWQLVGGKATIPRVPADSWTVNVEASDGRTWTGSIGTTGGSSAVTIE